MSELRAVIWDFDGTLVDTRQKNLNVTRALVEVVCGVPADSCEALCSLQQYEDALSRHVSWREFYRQELRMSDAQVGEAASQWMAFQLRDETRAELIDGVNEVVRALAHLPQGIVSLNARDNIRRFLVNLGVEAHFDEVIGYEAVGLERQKPAPDALVLCIERLTDLAPGRVLFVGDHSTDVECAINANQWFASRGVDVEVLSVGAQYGPTPYHASWVSEPHLRALTPRDILGFVESLPPRQLQP